MPIHDLMDPRNPVPTSGVIRPRNIKPLTSIRFFAALYVALYHFVRPYSAWGRLGTFMSAGYIGVSYFFILSGFILTYTHAQEYQSGYGKPSRFYIARLARVYPVYLVSMILAAYVSRGEFHNPIHVAAYLIDLVMLQSWSIRVVNFFNVPAWSLSTEVFFYLLFPFLVLRLRPSTRAKAALGFATCWALALLAPLFCLHVYPSASWHEEVARNAPGVDQVFRVRRLPILAVPQFLAGISLGWFYLQRGLSDRLSSILAATSVLSLGVCLFFSNHIPFILLHNGVLLPLYAMLLLGLCGHNWLARILSFAPLVLLGEASYALYLVHFLFNDWTHDQFGANFSIRAALWKLAIVIPLSILLHLYVERPCRRFILEWWRSRHPSTLKTVAT